MNESLPRPLYRADIDGLRAVAVLAVLIYHYGAPFPWPLLPGGFTGVDVFFVISGFLITRILYSDIEAGAFSVIGFYERRIRRIVPALLVMLATVIIAGKLLLMPGDYQSLAISAAASAFGASNVFFLNHTGYFDQAADLMPLLHTWSLGVEEQFYLVYPLLLFAIAARRTRLGIAAIMAVLAIVSLGVSRFWFNADPKAAFFMAIPRAWELALGALLVLLPKLPRYVSTAGTALGLALIVFGFLNIEATAFSGVAALPACIGAALVIWPKQQATAIARWLGKLAPIGLISYSLYLWHWPVWVFFRIYINNNQPRMRDALVLTAVSVTIAVLSYRFVERPFRRPGWQPSQTFGAGLLGCMAIFCAGMYVDSADGLPSRIPPALHAMRSADAMWDWPCEGYDVSAQEKSVCVFGAPGWFESGDKRALLWGDSIAQNYAPLLEEAARRGGISVMLPDACAPILDGADVLTSDARMPGYNGWCADTRRRILSELHRSDIPIVILAASWRQTYDRLIEPDKDAAFLRGLRATIGALKNLGKQIIILDQPPASESHDPYPCEMFRAALLRRPCADADRSLTLQAYRIFHTPSQSLLRQIAGEYPDVRLVVPGDSLCRGERCIGEIGGEPLYRDHIHLRRNLSQHTKAILASRIGLDDLFSPPKN